MKRTRRDILHQPENAAEIRDIAWRTLQRADAVGRLPTPIDEVIEAAKVTQTTDDEGMLEKFLSSVGENLRSSFLSATQKIRGFADLRERAIYIPRDTPPRVVFVKAHELGHEVIPWHTFRSGADVNFTRTMI